MTPFLRGDDGRGYRWGMLGVLIVLILGSVALVGVRAVVLKMLPFDNKSEFQVLVDMPEGTPLEDTYATLEDLAGELERVPEVTNYQLYAGTSAPINFNGLVRQYYLRRQPYQGDIQVNLVDKAARSRQSHEIASAVRPALAAVGARHGADVSVVEVPPGPPVLAPLVAEIYGLDYARQLEVARKVERRLQGDIADVVDVDTTIEAPQAKLVVAVDRARASKLGVSQQAAAATVAAALSGEDMSYLHDPQVKTPIPIRVELPANETGQRGAAAQPCASVPSPGSWCLSREIAEFSPPLGTRPIYHKDLLPVVYVTGDVAGGTDSPLYGMAAISSTLGETSIEGAPVQQQFIAAPDNPYRWSLKWDGSGRSPMKRSATWAPPTLSVSSSSTCWWWASSGPTVCRWSSWRRSPSPSSASCRATPCWGSRSPRRR